MPIALSHVIKVEATCRSGKRERLTEKLADEFAQPGPREEVFRWKVRIVRVPQLQFDPHCSYIPRKIKSVLSREIFPEGL